MTQNLETLIENAKKFIESTLASYSKPIIMSSFGKDSMVLLHLFKTMGITLPILFHREPFEPKKYIFANSVILAEEYTVYDYQPSRTSMAKTGDKVEIINHYQVGDHATIWLGTGIKEPEEGKPFLCGLSDIYSKPIGYFKFPWDVCLVGHKNCDMDPILGAIPLKVDINKTAACDYAYPLRYFSDEDVWEYTEKFDVAYNDRRYDKANGYKEFSDITYNNDYYHTCIRCIDKDEPDMVYCPKFKKQLVNISKATDYSPTLKLGYIGTK